MAQRERQQCKSRSSTPPAMIKAVRLAEPPLACDCLIKTDTSYCIYAPAVASLIVNTRISRWLVTYCKCQEPTQRGILLKRLRSIRVPTMRKLV